VFCIFYFLFFVFLFFSFLFSLHLFCNICFCGPIQKLNNDVIKLEEGKRNWFIAIMGVCTAAAGTVQLCYSTEDDPKINVLVSISSMLSGLTMAATSLYDEYVEKKNAHKILPIQELPATKGDIENAMKEITDSYKNQCIVD